MGENNRDAFENFIDGYALRESGGPVRSAKLSDAKQNASISPSLA
ncbi:hypothetical protein AB9F42_21050 [Rhizobium leguminosarum]|nr:hypothetical protein [Rhizobium leguminosarum]